MLEIVFDMYLKCFATVYNGLNRIQIGNGISLWTWILCNFVGFGILAYSDDKDIAYSSCIDHTSILPLPLFNPVIFENEENTFNFKIGEKSAAITISADIKENLEKAICKASARVSLRIGDMVALELAPPETAINRTDEEVHLKGEFCENSLFDFKMIF